MKREVKTMAKPTKKGSQLSPVGHEVIGGDTFGIDSYRSITSKGYSEVPVSENVNRPRKTGIKLSHVVAFVAQSFPHYFSGCGVQHRQRLLASV
jgi:hypothetical protein